MFLNRLNFESVSRHCIFIIANMTVELCMCFEPLTKLPYNKHMKISISESGEKNLIKVDRDLIAKFLIAIIVGYLLC